VTSKAIKEAEVYVRKALALQRSLGYTARVEPAIRKEAITEVARAIDRLQKIRKAA
jgi:hypothetical protein